MTREEPKVSGFDHSAIALQYIFQPISHKADPAPTYADTCIFAKF
ncbi:hypothetical protein [Argonema antarcticum]|nr:hypothetical protein [Argonema antarcticum]